VSNGRAAGVPEKAGGIQRPRFDPEMLVRHFTAVKIRRVTASEHENLDRLETSYCPPFLQAGRAVARL
jgi:hypothetical protein